MSASTLHRFPNGFLWGAATAAYQIEGSPLADGAGPSIWHRFCHEPGKVQNGDNGDIACDHYRQYAGDIELMRQLGLQAYRFSIAWGRVLPEGTGTVNQPGLDFYDRLVDALLDAGIVPMITLYHWDLPAALDERGGWLHRDVSQWFGDYADVLFRRLADRVPYWITLNEPWVVSDHGYLHGRHAPGHTGLGSAATASHNLLRASAEAVRRYRTVGEHAIGLTVNLEPKYAASQDAADLAATRLADAYMNRQFLDAALLGRYPDEMQEVFGEAWSALDGGEVEKLNEPLDFIGVNYYTRAVTRFAPDALPVPAESQYQPQSAYTEMGWEVYPAALTDTLVWLKERYGNPPVYITENGDAFDDPPPAKDGSVADPQRTAYLASHLLAVQTAIAEGCDVRGYFAWSLLDNFEWTYGYSKRFGLVQVDLQTQARSPKDSAKYYRRVIDSHGGCLTE